MKSREFKLNLSVPSDQVVSHNVARLRRYIREISSEHGVSVSAHSRMKQRATVRRIIGGFPGRGTK